MPEKFGQSDRDLVGFSKDAYESFAPERVYADFINKGVPASDGLPKGLNDFWDEDTVVDVSCHGEAVEKSPVFDESIDDVSKVRLSLGRVLDAFDELSKMDEIQVVDFEDTDRCQGIAAEMAAIAEDCRGVLNDGDDLLSVREGDDGAFED